MKPHRLKVRYFVVGDPTLDASSGEYVKDLEEMKRALMQTRTETEWRLVISIHGSQEILATQGGHLKEPEGKGVYGEAKLRKIFGEDAAFNEWRERYGPTWTTLNGCQVNAKLEGVLIQLLNRPRSSQKAQGLGKNCRPDTKIVPVRIGDLWIKRRSQWDKLSRPDQQRFISVVAELNRKFGYWGGPPVADSELLHYYFNETPGGWPVMTISINYADTGWSFYNRAHNTTFLKACKDNLGPLPPHKETVPP
jgi:hypothetical protein